MQKDMSADHAFDEIKAVDSLVLASTKAVGEACVSCKSFRCIV
jgi:hypothetical protein